MYSGQRNGERPAAVGLVRREVSESRISQHTNMIRRRAERLGYNYIYTVYPTVDDDDPIGHALGVAADLDADALFVYDLETVGHTPSRVCEMFDLETVSPPMTWAAAMPGLTPSAHAYPEHP